MLEITQLKFEYIKGKPLINGVSFTVSKGEKVAIYGALNSGKSTICQLIAKYVKGYDGSIKICGKEVKSTKIKQLNVLYIGEDLMLSDNQTVLKNAEYALKTRKFPKKEVEQKALESLEFCGLKNVAKLKAKELDYKQKFLLAFARGIARNPDLVLIDDVFFGKEKEEELYNLVKQIVLKTPLTTVFATSCVGALKDYNLRTIVLNYGEVGFDGQFLDSVYANE
ncbi:MAG: energy-coupling factor ABC transporter ATP-binding protein [Clostridia bacterium]|nr:energy-coupling factor ABC transporter ATP-binding protein [Clostridia bacterium]MBR2495915.1 energy-coupling factor ABC transporter ATP-binding protein [Clostridia bacterium]